MKFIFHDISFWDQLKIILKVCQHRNFSFEVPDEKIRLEDGQGNEVEAVRVDK